jgi:hypothetical protein
MLHAQTLVFQAIETGKNPQGEVGEESLVRLLSPQA